MKDLTITLDHRPGALAEMGQALGRAGIGIEGGGAFSLNGTAVGHFLFEDGLAARKVLEKAGIRVLEVRDVIAVRLDQEKPGQLGSFTRRLADAHVNIEVLYSDHGHRLIVVVDDMETAATVANDWMRR